MVPRKGESACHGGPFLVLVDSPSEDAVHYSKRATTAAASALASKQKMTELFCVRQVLVPRDVWPIFCLIV